MGGSSRESGNSLSCYETVWNKLFLTEQNRTERKKRVPILSHVLRYPTVKRKRIIIQYTLTPTHVRSMVIIRLHQITLDLAAAVVVKHRINGVVGNNLCVLLCSLFPFTPHFFIVLSSPPAFLPPPLPLCLFYSLLSSNRLMGTEQY